MILKEVDDHRPTDPMGKAGVKAEQDVAFHLRRRFERNPDVRIIHSIRLPAADGSDAAQMDHLVLHAGGIIVIESKSVSTEVRVNRHEEWERLSYGRWEGMPSPLKQVDAQVLYLRHYISDRRERLLGQVVGLQRNSGTVSFRRLVAISSSGIIHRPDNLDLADVVKADMLGDRVDAVMKEQVKGANKPSLFGAIAAGLKDTSWLLLTEAELERIVACLIADHRPLRPLKGADGKQAPAPLTAYPERRPAQPSQPPLAAYPEGTACTPMPDLRCSACGKVGDAITSGSYGYYLKCACGKNTSLKVKCRTCGKDRKLSKDGAVYVAVCGNTGARVEYHRS